MINGLIPTGGGDDPKSDRLTIKDMRKKFAATGADMWEKANKTGDYSKRNIQHMAMAAKAVGIDPMTALALSMQETKLGEADGNLGHVLQKTMDEYAKNPEYQKLVSQYKDIDPNAIASMYHLKGKFDVADKKGMKDEALRLQLYNGTYLKPDYSERDYVASQGRDPNIMYGLDLRKTGPIDLLKNPLYGKTVLDLRENVLKQNPELLSFVNDTLAGKVPLMGNSPAQPKVAGNKPIIEADGKQFVEDENGDLVDVATWNKLKGMAQSLMPQNR